MKKLIVICEGPTEQVFCKNIIKVHLKSFDIDVEYPLISHSNGGIVKWINLKPQIETSLAINDETFVTTFIDYYGLESHHSYPKWSEAVAEADKDKKMEILEDGMLKDILVDRQPRFIPYIQLHEFEALVFSKYSAFVDYYEPSEANLAGLQSICTAHSNPETINNLPSTAPSKRLKNNISRYDKVTHGVDICESIGIVTIRAKCPRFNNWIDKLEKI